MSKQNPTEKGTSAQEANVPGKGSLAGEPIPTIAARCGACKEILPGLNVITMMLPTPADGPQRGKLMTFLVTFCPLCQAVIPTQFIGYTDPAPGGVATPPPNLWRPGD